MDILSKQTVVQSRSLDEIERLAANKAELIEAIPSIQPIKNEDLNRMASGYGIVKILSPKRDVFIMGWTLLQKKVRQFMLLGMV